MKIAVDIDEVLGELVAELIAFHNGTYGTDHTRESYKNWDLGKVWNVDEPELYRRFYEFADNGGFRNLSPCKGAQEAIKELCKEHELFVVSARMHLQLQDTEEWIDEHFKGMFSGIHLTNDYGDGERDEKVNVCVREKADLIIEDDLKHANDCAKQGVHVLLFEAPWNVDEKIHENMTRVSSWDEILQHISTQK